MQMAKTALTAAIGGLTVLAAACMSTRLPQASGGRLEALSGLPAVSAVLTQKTGRRVLVYHSPRCDFCRAVLGSMERVLPELGAEAVIYTVDIDRNPDVRDAMGIGPVPVVLFLENGAEVTRWRVYRPGFMVRSGVRRFFAP